MFVFARVVFDTDFVDLQVKPVFVFDGKAPDLKKETLQRRRIRKGDATKKSRLASAKILDNYVRSQAVAEQLKLQTHAVNKVLAKGQEGLQQVIHNRYAQCSHFFKIKLHVFRQKISQHEN